MLPVWLVEVGDLKMEAVVGTGSNVNTISLEAFRMIHGEDSEKSYELIQSMDLETEYLADVGRGIESGMRIQGNAQIWVKIAGEPAELVTFFIADGLLYDFLLAMPWLRNTLAGNKFTNGLRPIPLEDCMDRGMGPNHHVMMRVELDPSTAKPNKDWQKLLKDYRSSKGFISALPLWQVHVGVSEMDGDEDEEEEEEREDQDEEGYTIPDHYTIQNGNCKANRWGGQKPPLRPKPLTFEAFNGTTSNLNLITFESFDKIMASHPESILFLDRSETYLAQLPIGGDLQLWGAVIVRIKVGNTPPEDILFYLVEAIAQYCDMLLGWAWTTAPSAKNRKEGQIKIIPIADRRYRGNPPKTSFWLTVNLHPDAPKNKPVTPRPGLVKAAAAEAEFKKAQARMPRVISKPPVPKATTTATGTTTTTATAATTGAKGTTTTTKTPAAAAAASTTTATKSATKPATTKATNTPAEATTTPSVASHNFYDPTLPPLMPANEAIAALAAAAETFGTKPMKRSGGGQQEIVFPVKVGLDTFEAAYSPESNTSVLALKAYRQILENSPNSVVETLDRSWTTTAQVGITGKNSYLTKIAGRATVRINLAGSGHEEVDFCIAELMDYPMVVGLMWLIESEVVNQVKLNKLIAEKQVPVGQRVDRGLPVGHLTRVEVHFD